MAPTCIGISGVSMYRKLASRPDSCFILVVLHESMVWARSPRYTAAPATMVRGSPRRLRERAKRMRVRRPGAVEEGLDRLPRDVFDASRVPPWCLVLVDGQRTDAFHRLAGRARPQV